MALSYSDQSTTANDISEETKNNQEENPTLKSKSLQYKEENASFNEQIGNSLTIPHVNQHPMSQSALFPEKSQSSIITEPHPVGQWLSMNSALNR
ncbi:unnamed protein product [Rotaria sp. Silwood2]|nr:unnamed protein product [Rotaria sp. Silwood2]CAF3092648.1 unnamed protein product [Rotaria sp. Silwood2]CAF3165343.1 unnamed protein product [Rotaria sp. Silwood2]CAF3250036.1 unnamed protein product [Rotaria sp. Silwood2]CAF4277696.1 unnamed protein product [Rotaria sp. Silwood2]